jgi:hypothetical protein
VSMTLRSSVGSHAAAIAFGAIAAAILPIAHVAQPQSLAEFLVAICAQTFHPASAVEASYLADNVSAMTKMMVNMGIRPSGDVDSDFVAMMTPHHQGAIEMAQAELRYGRNEKLMRLKPGNHSDPAARDCCNAAGACPAATAAYPSTGAAC